MGVGAEMGKVRLVLAVGLLLGWSVPSPAEPVRVGDLGIVADAPFYIGMEKGYFAAQGIEIALQRFASAAQTTVPLASGNMEVAGGAMSAALFNAFARGLPIRTVMARTRDMPGYSSDSLIVRSDLRAEIRSPKDLKGRKIAINVPGAALDYVVGKILASEGVAFSDVHITYIPWPDMGAAFANKGIDAGAVVEPFAAQYNDRNLAFPFRRAADVIRDPPMEVSVILYSKDWSDRNPDQATAFTVAYLQGARDYYDAMKGGPKRQEVVEILARHTPLKDKAVYDRIQWSYMDPNAELSIASLKDQQEWYAAHGSIEKKVAVEEMVDNRFIERALAKLGHVETK